MSHHYCASFKTCHLFYLFSENKSNATEANRIWALLDHPLNYNITAFGFRPFCNHYNAKSFSFLISLFYLFCNAMDVIGDFRDENDISSSSHSGVESNPSRPMTHYFYNHNSMKGFSGGVNSVYSFCCNGYGRKKTESDICSSQIVVDCFRQSNNRNTVFKKPMGNPECSISTNAYQTVYIKIL